VPSSTLEAATDSSSHAAAGAAPDMRVAVIGAGSWGSAVAWLLGSKGADVRLWARDPELARDLNTTRHNPRYLAEVAFPPTVCASTDLAATLMGAEAVVLATPSAVVREISGRIASQLGAETPVVLLSKGIEAQTGAFLLDVLAESLGAETRLAVLSGPNHAEEVARAMPSATVVASSSDATAGIFQTLFSTPAFRVYTSCDTVGVQLCGAAKNVIALSCGLAAGMGLGDNTAALLMTRGLAEIGRLAVKLGGDALTCMGLAGMGDLIATCTSPHSRNRSFGLELAQGGSLEAYQARTHMVVEGALACRSVTALAQVHGVDMPISTMVRSVVWEQQPLDEALASLIERSFKPEFY
jgi:glycerol-3-phosphate dehydrogenase (NAD(P)+)